MKLVFAPLIIAAAVQQVSASPRDELLRAATNWLLNGDSMPSDIDDRLMQLEPADRIEVLVFLRRSGLLTAPVWAADRLLAPSTRTERDE